MGSNYTSPVEAADELNASGLAQQADVLVVHDGFQGMTKPIGDSQMQQMMPHSLLTCPGYWNVDITALAV